VVHYIAIFIMKLSQFFFDLPKNKIAYYPLEERGASKLMVVNRTTKEIEHKTFKDILDYFGEGDVLIYNNTRVFPAKLYGTKEKTQAKIEVFLLRELNKEYRLWDVLVDPARKIRVGNKLYFGNGELVAEVVDNTTSRGRTIRFLYEGDDNVFYKKIDRLGLMPLPDYITEKREAEQLDREAYQTIFAKEEPLGSVASPAAGLHFTKEIMKRLELQGVKQDFVTLYLGRGCFSEVEVEDLTKHKMDSENYFISEKVADTVNTAKKNKKRICAVGCSTLRAVESSVSASYNLQGIDNGWTNRFFFPPYDFRVCNAFFTNFHDSCSTMYMMACAFGDYELISEAYQIAIKEKYRFLAYGDAMLIIS